MNESCKGDLAERDKAIFYCLLDTGARASEFLAFNLQDVNLFTGAVQIKHGKGNKDRAVFLGTRSRQALKAHLKTRMDDNTALWVTETGTRLERPGLRQILRRRAATRIPTPGARDFRRAFA